MQNILSAGGLQDTAHSESQRRQQKAEWRSIHENDGNLRGHQTPIQMYGLP